jgi:glycosyltransferase involved in cell wall biosynthesis
MAEAPLAAGVAGSQRAAPGPPVRLLFVVNVAWFFVSHRLPLALEARRRGWDVHVAAVGDDTVAVLDRSGVKFHPIPVARRGKGLVGEFTTYRALVRLYRRLQPDIVHHVTSKAVLWGSLAARRTGRSAVVNAISGLGYLFVDEAPMTRLIRTGLLGAYRFAFRQPRCRVIFQNPDDLNDFVSRGTVDQANTVLIGGSGVDLDRFVPAPEPPEPAIVVLASRMLWHKGVREFVEAASLLADRDVRVRMVLVGETDDGNPAAVPRDQLLEWDRLGYVEWWGHRNEMPAVFAAAHVACLPSYAEGLPKVLLEASAAGLPLVATDVPGCREVVRPGENGLLVPARDPGALADAIQELVAAGELRNRFGRRSRELACAEFGIQQVVDQTFSLYQELRS